MESEKKGDGAGGRKIQGERDKREGEGGKRPPVIQSSSGGWHRLMPHRRPRVSLRTNLDEAGRSHVSWLCQGPFGKNSANNPPKKTNFYMEDVMVYVEHPIFWVKR